MALAALVWLTRAFACHGMRRWLYGALALLAAANVLLMVQGRTGYVALVVGMGIWLLLTLRRRQRVAVIACGVVAVAMLALIPNLAMERLTLGVQQVRHCVLAPQQRLIKPAITRWGSAPPLPANRGD